MNYGYKYTEEKFDCTKWQESYFENKTSAQIDKKARHCVAEHPFKGNARIIL